MLEINILNININSNITPYLILFDILNKRFKQLLKEIGIKERNIYNLRHTFASYMISNIQNGVDILWVSKMLGHKDVSIFLKFY